MNPFTLKGRSAFETKTYQIMVGFGVIALLLTLSDVLHVSWPLLAKTTWGTLLGCVHRISEMPQALLVGAIALLTLYLHQRFWATATWHRVKSGVNLVSQNETIETWRNRMGLVAFLAVPFAAFNLAYYSSTNSWLETTLGIMMVIFLALILVSMADMSEWLDEAHGKAGAWKSAVETVVCVAFGLGIAFGSYYRVGFEGGGVVAALFGVMTGVLFKVPLFILELPRIEPVLVETPPELAEDAAVDEELSSTEGKTLLVLAECIANEFKEDDWASFRDTIAEVANESKSVEVLKELFKSLPRDLQLTAARYGLADVLVREKIAIFLQSTSEGAEIRKQFM